MTNKANIAEALNAIGITTSMARSKIKKLSPRQLKIRNAAPSYLTEDQCTALSRAGKAGWRGRSIVTCVKEHTCAVSLEADGNVYWVKPDGVIEGEDWVLLNVLTKH